MNELIVKQEAIMPLMTIQEAVSRYNAVVEFTKEIMKVDRDYGKVPGTDKPTLLKPGAEKLCSLFGFAPRFEIIDKIVDFDKGLFYFQYRCELYRGDLLVGSGVGSCNSRENKYRYRYQMASWKPSKEEADKLKAEKKGKWGKNGDAWVWLERVENSEPYDILNTIDKMSQKRSLVAATLIATNASEFFTQDMEEIEYVDAEASDVTEPGNGGKQTESKAKPRAAFSDKITPNDIMQNELAENIQSASWMMNNLALVNKSLPDGLEVCKLYRRWRATLEPKDAAVKTLAGEVPMEE